MPTVLAGLSPTTAAPTSGTTTFNLDLAQAIEEAFERAGSELKTGYDFRTARRSMNLLFADWGNRGLNMWTFDQQTIALTANTSLYTLPDDTVDVLDMYVRTTANGVTNDRVVNRISLTTYDNIPNKGATGLPTQVLVQRSQPPVLRVWQVPATSNTYTLVYWRLRRIQDAGDGTNVPDIPFRFLPVLVAGLAYYLCLKVPDGLSRIDVLKAQYDEAWQLASEEDREKASVRLVPRRSF